MLCFWLMVFHPLAVRQGWLAACANTSIRLKAPSPRKNIFENVCCLWALDNLQSATPQTPTSKNWVWFSSVRNLSWLFTNASQSALFFFFLFFAARCVSSRHQPESGPQWCSLKNPQSEGKRKTFLTTPTTDIWQFRNGWYEVKITWLIMGWCFGGKPKEGISF